eukprot:TRINITY_DN3423_c0_g1_i3.p1 TRINITY_DN3423_c0_g1~~TRINITY_DN3423_c0_g1_i3.p1  ORF type:complete len:523 (-),score=122.70 TRINITY_DN3423_c0_g1_i3:419-1987(-)
MFLPSQVQYNPNGAYQVRLCRGGQWHTVLVDDVFPVTKHGLLAYSKAGRRQLWVPLVEKAAAKLFGSYERLASGTLSEALTTFTGFPTEQMLLGRLPQNRAFNEVPDEQQPAGGWGETGDSEFMWAKLLSFHSAGFLIGAACCNVKCRELGLRAPHAYAVYDVRNVRGHKMVKLRDPQGQNDWKGDWSKNSDLWTWELKQELRVDHEDDGVCWMSWDDIARCFASIEVSRIHPDFLEARLPGWLPSGVGLGNGVKLEVFEPTELELQLIQEAHQQRTQAHNTLVDLGFAVLKRKQEGGYELVADCMRQVAPTVNSSFHAEPGEYLFVPLCFNQRRSFGPRRYVSTCHSASPLCIEKVPSEAQVTAEAMCLRARKHGERKSPQPGVFTYTMTSEAGMMITCENTSGHWVSIEVDCSESEGLVSSRDTNDDLLFTSDVLAPMSKQLLMVLAPKEGSSSYRYAMRLQSGRTEEAVEQHMPAIDPEDPFGQIHQPIHDPSLASSQPVVNVDINQVLTNFLANRQQQ